MDRFYIITNSDKDSNLAITGKITEYLGNYSYYKEKKKDLEDPSVIEKKAREDLGLVKEREIPYIK